MASDEWNRARPKSQRLLKRARLLMGGRRTNHERRLADRAREKWWHENRPPGH